MQKALMCLICLADVCLFGQSIPFGEEFRVNTYTAGDQAEPQITTLANGNFVICWKSWGWVGEGSGVYGQLFSPDGNRIGQEFRINTCQEGTQSFQQITTLSNGDFVICWMGDGQDGDDWGVYGQLFSLDGNKIGHEFSIHTYKEGYQKYPQITSLLNGGFVVCWTSEGQDDDSLAIYGRVFSSDGNKIGQEFLIKTYTKAIQKLHQIKSLSNGGFVVCWMSEGPDGDGWGVYGQVFSSDGNKIGQEFLINKYMIDDQQDQQIASLRDGAFVVCWQSLGQDGSVWGVYGQVFTSAGDKKGQEFLINTYTELWQCYPQITSLPNGDFVVCWVSLYQDDSFWGLYGQIFSADGARIGREFHINAYIENAPWTHNITSLRNGSFVVCWMSDIDYGVWTGVYGQIFSSDGNKIGREFCIKTCTEGYHGAQQVTSLPNGSFVVCWMSESQDGSGLDIYAKRFPESPLNHPLKPFSLLRPSNDSSIKTVRPLLTWQQPSDQIVCFQYELHYKVFIHYDPEFLSPRVIEQDQDTTVTLMGLKPGTTYFWKVLAKNIAGDSLWSSNTNAFFVTYDTTSWAETISPDKPKGFMLYPNYPNPFNPETTIRYDLPIFCLIEISIYDISGKLVKVLMKESRTVGSNSVTWDGKDSAGNPLPSGIYVCRMEARTADGHRFTQSVKMGLVR